MSPQFVLVYKFNFSKIRFVVVFRCQSDVYQKCITFRKTHSRITYIKYESLRFLMYFQHPILPYITELHILALIFLLQICKIFLFATFFEHFYIYVFRFGKRYICNILLSVMVLIYMVCRCRARYQRNIPVNIKFYKLICIEKRVLEIKLKSDSQNQILRLT